jgi:hypothetical protein
MPLAVNRRRSASVPWAGGKLALFLQDLRDSAVKGHPVTVRSISGADDLSGCHLVVMLTDDRRKVADLLDRSRRQPILTVAELSGFSRDGGAVELLLEGNRIRFRINLGAARANRLSSCNTGIRPVSGCPVSRSMSHRCSSDARILLNW